MEKNALKGWNKKSILDVGVKICILVFLIVTLFNTIFYEFKINANIKIDINCINNINYCVYICILF